MKTAEGLFMFNTLTTGLMLILKWWYQWFEWCYVTERTWHLSGSSWAHCPGSVCTATDLQIESDLPCRCSPPSAAPHQTATAQQTRELQRKRKNIFLNCTTETGDAAFPISCFGSLAHNVFLSLNMFCWLQNCLIWHIESQQSVTSHWKKLKYSKSFPTKRDSQIQYVAY